MTGGAQGAFLALVKKLMELGSAGHEVWLGWNGRDGYISFSAGEYMVRNIRATSGDISVALEGMRRKFGGQK